MICVKCMDVLYCVTLLGKERCQVSDLSFEMGCPGTSGIDAFEHSWEGYIN